MENTVISHSFLQKLNQDRSQKQLNGSVKEPNISIYFFFLPSLNGVLFLMFCLLVEGECQILVF